MNFDWLIVGAGLTGSTFAERIANVKNESVLLIDQRSHIAGNAWDDYNKEGILEHKYGPHIFHTNSEDVWEYLSRFTDWRFYEHKVLASIEGQLVPIPFNLNSIERLFPEKKARIFCDKLINNYGLGSNIPILHLKKSQDPDLIFLSDYIYKNVFEGYTLKQWGMKPEELSPSVTARVPISVSKDDRYFQDKYQAIPSDGYGVMVTNMLRHKNISLKLNTKWQNVRSSIKFKKVIFTGPVDEYFNYKYGELPYRSLRFDIKTYDIEKYQNAAVINFPNANDFTRVTEMKWLTGQIHKKSTTFTEYPQPHIRDETTPYYPIPTEKNKEIYKLYEAEANLINENILFAGRLADYIYYNMDQAVARALSLFNKNDIFHK